MQKVDIKLFRLPEFPSSQYMSESEAGKMNEKLVKLSGLGIIPECRYVKRDQEDTGYTYYNLTPELDGDVFCTEEDVIAILSEGIKVKFERPVVKTLDISDIFSKVETKAEIVTGGTNVYNQKCEVHMPGQALATYNEVCLLEDMCTDELQSVLTKGWRLIAACPQPDQRRPDYILGRFNPDMQGEHGASRNGD